MKIVILGGVAAGTKVVAKVMRECPDAEVTIITKSASISYAGCALPYYIGGVIEDKASLIVNTPEKFSALTGANVITNMEATQVDAAKKEVTAKSTVNGEVTTFSYDKLVIATGARAFVPPIPGHDLPNVFTMRTPEDAIAFRSLLEGGSVKRVVVCGAGFIGLEIAENIARRDIRVNVVEMQDQILPNFDKDIADYAERTLLDAGIGCFTSTKVLSILSEGKVETSGRTFKADAVVLALGIRANTEFLLDSGIALMPNKTIKVNEMMETSLTDVYACGDCVTVTNRLTGKPVWSPMGSSANIEGRIVAENLLGAKKCYAGALGTGVVRLPSINLGRTGLGEKEAVAAGYDVVSALSIMDDKAHYYPGSDAFIIKLTADRKTRQLLSCHVLGKGNVDKIVDIAATAISLHATIDDLENMDLAYAPPFSTALHPFTVALNVLENKLSGKMVSMTPEAFAQGCEAEIIDANPAPTLEGKRHFALEDLAGTTTKEDKEKALLLVCRRGRRAYLTQRKLRGMGFTKTTVLEGGVTFNEIDEEA